MCIRDRSVTGPVNGLLHTSINFMTLPEAFRPIYIISGIWQGAGWASIMYTASLSNASKDLKEAAMIDGANLIDVYKRQALGRRHSGQTDAGIAGGRLNDDRTDRKSVV